MPVNGWLVRSKNHTNQRGIVWQTLTFATDLGLGMANTFCFIVKRRRRYVNYVSIKSMDPTRKNSYGRCIYVSHIYHIHIRHMLIATVTMVHVHMSHVPIATVTIIHVNPMIEGLSCSCLHDRSLEKYIIITIMTMFDMLTANLKTVNIVSMVVCSGAVARSVSMVVAISIGSVCI